MTLTDILPWGEDDTPDESDPQCVHDWTVARTERMATGAPASYDADRGLFVIETADFIMEWECEFCGEASTPAPKHGPPKVDGTEMKHKAQEFDSWEVGE